MILRRIINYDEKELVLDKLAVNQVVLLLEEKPISTGEMSEKLGLNLSDVSGHLTVLPGHGMVSCHPCKLYVTA